MTIQPLRLCLFATFDPRNWSGGRYHAMMMATAAAHAGFETHVVANHKAVFADELASLSDQRWQLHQVDDFVRKLPAGQFDFVILVPTGVFLPEFYEGAIAFARDRASSVVLLNFETANWFNSVVETKRDPRLWDYWQRVCLDGALVLSSTRTSHEMARKFYFADRGSLRFEIWRPPVNSLASQRWDGSDKEGGVVTFVRESDIHKGSTDLLSIDPRIFMGRPLDIVSGTALTQEFQDRISRHFRGVRGASIRFHSRISDNDKFRLLSTAQALLFPSRFEGYGYPPIEAAFAGTETACYELEVLRETVGSIAHFARRGEAHSLEAALRASLAIPSRRETLRAAVRDFAEFRQSAVRLGDILIRSREVVAAPPKHSFRVAWGPWSGTRPVTVTDTAPVNEEGYLPPSVVSIRRRGDCLLLTLCISARQASVAVVAKIDGVELGPAPLAAPVPNSNGWWRGTAYLLLPSGFSGRDVQIELHGDGEHARCQHLLRVDTPPPEVTRLPTRAGISKIQRNEASVEVEGWVLSDTGASEVWTLAGTSGWFGAELSIHRSDIARQHPGYPRYKCGYRISLPASSRPESGMPLYVLTNGGWDEILDGWPPRPVVRPAELLRARLWAKAFRVRILHVTDSTWLNGVKRQGIPERPAAVLVARTPRTAMAMPGDILELPSGRQRQVVEVHVQDTAILLQLDLPISQMLDSGKNGHARLRRGAPEETADIAVQTVARTDEIWWNGVWNVRDARYRRGLLVNPSATAAALLRPGSIISTETGGRRRVTEIEWATEGLRLWLDGKLTPFGDGAPYPVQIRRSGGPLRAASLRLAENAGSRDQQSTMTFKISPAARKLARGDLLEFAHGCYRRVVSTQSKVDAIEVTLDASVTGTPSWVDSVTRRIERSTPIFTVPPFKAKDPAHIRLAALARRDGRDLPDATSYCTDDRPRILFLTPVPPFPANQGNRVVTRNFIDHLVDLGFDVDVILQGSTDVAAVPMMWGDRVRFFLIPSPTWGDSENAAMRREVLARSRQTPLCEAERCFHDTIERTANEYHPLFIVRDETVDIAKSLYRRYAYSHIVCNYTHMLRVPIELAAIEPLPRVVVVTHDALSRLPTKIGAVKLDTTYRACTPAIERETLDRIPGATIVAISQAERTYFESIGVANQIVICEYDSIEEMKQYQVPIDGFERRTLLFQGSGNPMNVVGLAWFLDSCWDTILEHQPDAILVVCGLVSSHIPPNLPNVVSRGDVSRSTLLAQMRDASISINPCLAGTGLKIKTVEACCAGLPSVCTPLATEGLEDAQAEFALVAIDAAAFAAACISLLQDRQRWEALRSGSLATAYNRFSRAEVYRRIDAAAGWALDAETHRLTPRPSPEEPPLDLAAVLTDPADRFAKERAAVDHPDDPRCALDAGVAALDGDDGWSAAVHGGAICARRPELIAGYQLIARGLDLLTQHDDAADSLSQALALDPDNPALRGAYCTVAAKGTRPVAAFRDHPFLTLRVGLNEAIELTAATLGWRKPGWGWAGPESWGMWTDGPAARLRLDLDDTIHGPCHLILRAHARAEADIPAKIAITANGQCIGRWTWTGSAHQRQFCTPLPAELVARRCIVLDVLIGSPRMVESDGKIVDARRLGLAVSRIIVSSEPPQNAFTGDSA